MDITSSGFFQRWETLPAQWEGCATAHCLGAGQAPVLVSAIEVPPLANSLPESPVWCDACDAACCSLPLLPEVSFGAKQGQGS